MTALLGTTAVVRDEKHDFTPSRNLRYKPRQNFRDLLAGRGNLHYAALMRSGSMARICEDCRSPAGSELACAKPSHRSARLRPPSIYLSHTRLLPSFGYAGIWKAMPQQEPC
jgi:hypothetical protein